MMFRIDSIKHAARKEAWYGDGTAYNPFRKTTRSSSWAGRPLDLEAACDVDDGPPPLTAVSSDPGSPVRHYGVDGIVNNSGEGKPEEVEMTSAHRRPSALGSEETAVENLSSGDRKSVV